MVVECDCEEDADGGTGREGSNFQDLIYLECGVLYALVTVR